MDSRMAIVCGDLTGTLNVENFSATRKCISCIHGDVKPRDFERLAGREACKSWKRSIRAQTGGSLFRLIESGKLTLHDVPPKKQVTSQENNSLSCRDTPKKRGRPFKTKSPLLEAPKITTPSITPLIASESLLDSSMYPNNDLDSQNSLINQVEFPPVIQNLEFLKAECLKTASVIPSPLKPVDIKVKTEPKEAPSFCLKTEEISCKKRRRPFKNKSLNGDIPTDSCQKRTPPLANGTFPVKKKRHRRTKKELEEARNSLALIEALKENGRSSVGSRIKCKRFRTNKFEKGLNHVQSSNSDPTNLRQKCPVCGAQVDDTISLSYHDMLFHSAVSSTKLFGVPQQLSSSSESPTQPVLDSSIFTSQSPGKLDQIALPPIMTNPELTPDHGGDPIETPPIESDDVFGHKLTRGTLAKLASIGVHTPLSEDSLQKDDIKPDHHLLEQECSSRVISNVVTQYKQVLELSKEALEETNSLNKRMGNIADMIKSIKSELKCVSDTLELSNVPKLVVRDDVTSEEYHTFFRILQKFTNSDESNN